ncbi:unnamed protein product [Caenorhabditis brenneri]
MWSKRSFKPGQRAGNVTTCRDYDRNRLFAMLNEDDAWKIGDRKNVGFVGRQEEHIGKWRDENQPGLDTAVLEEHSERQRNPDVLLSKVF